MINIKDYAPKEHHICKHSHNTGHVGKKMTMRAMKAENSGADSLDSHDHIQTPASEYILKTDKEIAEEAKKKEHEIMAIQNEEKLKMQKYFDR